MYDSGARVQEIIDLAVKDFVPGSYPLFTNKQHNKLTKEGVAYVINKYAVIAHESSDKVPEKVRCHMILHSKAVHLLQTGVNLIYIRDFLGHSDIKTTEIYARADVELKRKALENVPIRIWRIPIYRTGVRTAT